jgi:hypothetical protein
VKLLLIKKGQLAQKSYFKKKVREVDRIIAVENTKNSLVKLII